MGSNLVAIIQILDGNGVKSMPGSIPAPNYGSFDSEIRKIQVAKWDATKKVCGI